MKQLLIKLTASIIGMLIGLLLLLITHQPIPLLAGFMFLTVNYLYLIYTLLKLLGIYKIFEFKHIYERSDILDNKTWIIKELNIDERTQLKYYDPCLFINSPILVDDINEYPSQIKVTGWVKARNTEEAKRILHYTTHFDDL
jgi:hypothetical protein